MAQQLPLWLEAHPPAGGEHEARRLVVGDRVLYYTLRRARRRTLGMTIDGGEIRIGAPRASPLREIEDFIRQHAEWIAGRIDAWRASPARRPIPIADGVAVPLLGGFVTLRVEGAAGARRSFTWGAQDLHLKVGAGDAAMLLERALRERAAGEFGRRIETFCRDFALPPVKFRLSGARRRWGSCSRHGICLNWRLIHAAPDLIDYLIAHELAHRKEMNHGPRFWAEVARLCPGHAEARRALNAFADAVPHFV